MEWVDGYVCYFPSFLFRRYRVGLIFSLEPSTLFSLAMCY